MRLIRSCLIVVFGSVLGSVCLMAQADDAKPVTRLSERLDAQANISMSGRVFGVVEREAFDGGFDRLGRSLEAYTSGGGQLCVRYRSRNGLYTAWQHFEVAGQGWTGVPFETEHSGALAKLGGTGLAAKALVAADCADVEETASLAPVRRRGRVSNSFYLIAHTDRSDAYVLVYPKGKSSPLTQRCDKLTGGGSIVFDTKCPLPAQAFDEGGKTVLVIRRPDGKLRRELVFIVSF